MSEEFMRLVRSAQMHVHGKETSVPPIMWTETPHNFGAILLPPNLQYAICQELRSLLLKQPWGNAEMESLGAHLFRASLHNNFFTRPGVAVFPFHSRFSLDLAL
jgi:hypothetical protein